eukprot:TRINITY_DN2095_c0_g1_i1.p2 TRINITY_DN2095_c0_g1~~TRINITY_DN2095_c0_g1_i1.p2  ORF type:complete len:186 (+),score=34.31 TRINITY_DN2095_c0_g1_i1:184-741(+)
MPYPPTSMTTQTTSNDSTDTTSVLSGDLHNVVPPSSPTTCTYSALHNSPVRMSVLKRVRFTMELASAPTFDTPHSPKKPFRKRSTATRSAAVEMRRLKEQEERERKFKSKWLEQDKHDGLCNHWTQRWATTNLEDISDIPATIADVHTQQCNDHTTQQSHTTKATRPKKATPLRAFVPSLDVITE